MPQETPPTDSGKWRPQHPTGSQEAGPPTSKVWLHYHRLEGSASPCCTLPADWSTRPGPQGQPGQLGPGVRMSRPAQCTLHCMLVDCGRLHRISIGRQGSRAPPPDTKGHCLGAGGFIHSTSDQPPGSLSQDPQFSKKAAPSDTFFRPVLCAMGKSAATRARQGRRLGKAQRDALRSQPQPDADPRATVADEPVGLPLTECTITVEGDHHSNKFWSRQVGPRVTHHHAQARLLCHGWLSLCRLLLHLRRKPHQMLSNRLPRTPLMMRS